MDAVTPETLDGEAPAAEEEILRPGPGIYSDIEEDDYHASWGVSVSRLKRFAEAPAKVTVPFKETPALRFGKLAHCAILQPHLLEARYHVTQLKTFDQRTAAYKAEQARAGGRELVKQADWDSAMRVRDAVYQHPTLRGLFRPDGLRVEESFYWIDEETGLMRRGRADGRRSFAFDIKSTESAHPDDFGRSIANYSYHWQAAAYEDGYAALGEPVEGFIFIAIEKEAPYLVGIYEIPDEDKDRARKVMAHLLKRWAECEKSGVWPGYFDQLTSLTLPGWCRNDDEALLMPGAV